LKKSIKFRQMAVDLYLNCLINVYFNLFWTLSLRGLDIYISVKLSIRNISFDSLKVNFPKTNGSRNWIILKMLHLTPSRHATDI
jgi:hypothetical protein